MTMTMTMMKLNHDQKAVQYIMSLSYIPRFYNVFVLKKVLLNSVEENDNNHRRSIMYTFHLLRILILLLVVAIATSR